MKTILQINCNTIFIIAALFFVRANVLNSQNCNYTWASQSSGTTSILYSVKAVNELICWSAGSSGTVRRTTDGGSTWLNANPNPGVIIGNIVNIDAIDAANAWVTTSQSTNTFIYKTTNAGINWTQVYTQTGGFINGIHMISGTNGFAFGDPLSNSWRILATTSGGQNWLPHPLAPSALAGESGFENCFQVSLPHMWFGSSLGTVYRTTNNGVNWTSVPTPGINSYVFAVHFNSLTLGLVAALSMVRSTDAGASYTPINALGMGNINGIDGSGNEFWYIRGSSIYRSTNGGDNWTFVYDAGNTQLHIDLVNSSSGCLTGWTVGMAGMINKMTGSPLGVNNNNNSIPDEFALKQNYPNPFNPVTKIEFALPYAGFVELNVYDVYGSEIARLINSNMNAGNHSYSFEAAGLASGVYFYTFKAGGYTKTRKMVLIK